MKVFRTIEDYEKGPKPVLTIGTFDGVHIGHQKILERVVQSAKALGGESVLISFDPHPRLVLYPEDNPLRLINTVEEKIEILSGLGIDKLLLIPFSRDFSRLTSEEFIRSILVDKVGLHRIIIGYDHHFGKNREGSLKDLLNGAGIHDYGVEEVSAFQIGDTNVSSTKIRNALHEGNIRLANEFLGYTYMLNGKVIHGRQMGRQLGFPTANIQASSQWKLIPATGVYFVKVLIAGNWHFGMSNIGYKPTFGEHTLGVEVHVFDFDKDLYDSRIRMVFLDRIRPERKFPDLDALKSQLHKDESWCRQRIEAGISQ